MAKIITINTAQYFVGEKDKIIETSGVGSCLVICIYDEYNKIGGMAHSMLPTRHHEGFRAEEDGLNYKSSAKYVDEVIGCMVRDIMVFGGKKSYLKAKLTGGSEMFSMIQGPRLSIGVSNIQMAKKVLAENRIPIVSENIGGSIGRTASFCVENCLLSVTIRL